MNITANNVASKLFVAFVASAMLFTLATPVKAQTAAELQAQIDALMAQIATLSGTTSTGSTAAACTFTRALTVGSQGEDVKCLQTYLTPTYFTNAGGATGYFGPVTAAAVAAWQSANGVMPAAGYFGPVSQAKYTALMAAAPATPGEDDSDEDTSSDELSGEASLDSFEIDSASDDEVEEGAEDAEVAVATVEFADGDASISRIDVSFVDASTSPVDTDAWDVLDEVKLFVDGDEVGSMSASDEDDYLDEDNGTLRFSGLDIVAMEDEELEITITATVQGSVDSDDLATFEVSVDTLRFFDADGVATTEDGAVGPDDFGDTVDFTLVQAGNEDELIVKTSDEDPDGTTLQVEDDAKSDFFNVFTFDLDTDDSTNDIELNTVVVTVEVSAGDTYAALVDDAELVIDGVTIDDVSVANSGTATATLTFDVDGDVTIDAGERVAAELNLRFKALASGDEGATVMGKVTSAQADLIAAEGADDLADSQTSGAATGDVHTLRTAGINVAAGDIDATVTTGDNDDDDYATYSIEIEVTAFEQDVYIDTDPATSVTYTLEDGSGVATTSGSKTVTLTSTGDEVDGTFEITEGSTETITLEVTYDPSVTTSTAARLQLETLIFGSTSGAPTGQTWTASPDEDYRTGTVTIVN